MNRREFGCAVAGTMLTTASTLATAQTSAGTVKDHSQPTVLFDVSVMLWTVYQDLPFEQRLEKVAAAGYKNVELVGEYEHWSDADFDRANAKRKQLGITFDCTASLKHGLCNPAERNALIAEFRRTIPIMERLDCPALMCLYGFVVPGTTLEA